VANVRRVSCPILLFHGDADRLVPTAMGMSVAAAAAGPVEVVLIHGAGHNDTYDIGGRSYRDKMWRFIGRTGPQITPTGTIRARVASKPRSASSSVRSTTPASPSAHFH